MKLGRLELFFKWINFLNGSTNTLRWKLFEITALPPLERKSTMMITYLLVTHYETSIKLKETQYEIL